MNRKTTLTLLISITLLLIAGKSFSAFLTKEDLRESKTKQISNLENYQNDWIPNLKTSKSSSKKELKKITNFKNKKKQDDEETYPLNLHFDRPMIYFTIFNDIDRKWYKTDVEWENETNALIELEEGEYGILVKFPIENSDNTLDVNVVIQYFEVVANGTNNVSVFYEEAQNKISFNSVDSQGNPFDKTENYAHTVGINIKFGTNYILDEVGNYNSHKFNRLDERVTLYPSEIKYDYEKVHLTAYGPYNGLTDDLVVTNSQDNYIQSKINTDIDFLDENTEYYSGIIQTTWDFYGPYFFFNGVQHYNSLMPYREDFDFYIMDTSDKDYAYSFNLSVWSSENDEYKEIMHTPLVRRDNDKISLFRNKELSYYNYSLMENESFNLQPALTSFMMEDLEYQGITYHFPYFAIGNQQEQFEYLNQNEIRYKLYDSDENVLEQGIFDGVVALELDNNDYQLEWYNSTTSLRGIPIELITKQTFTADKNYSTPSVSLMTFRNSDSIPKREFELEEEAEMVFVIYDKFYSESEMNYYLAELDTDSVELYYSKHNQDNWIEQDKEFVDFQNPFFFYGTTFRSNISNLTLEDSTAYDIRIVASDADGNIGEYELSPAFFVGDYGQTSAENEVNNYTSNIKTYPNPFRIDNNRKTQLNIKYEISEKSTPVQIDIFNLKGQKIKRIFEGEKNKGTHSLYWDSLNRNNEEVASGIYFIKLKTNKTEKIQKLIILK